MKVKKLIKMLLSEADDDTEVHLSTDEEGNGFGDVSESVMLSTLKENGKKVVVLYPENQFDYDIYEDENEE